MNEKLARIYHNPRCSKSRAALAILEEKGIKTEVIEYLKTPPTKAELRELLKKLGMKPEELVRKGEEIYKAHYQNKDLSGDAWLDALVANPVLIERPIIIYGDQAVVARPPERVLEII